jgi:hypothetical protein
MSLASLFEECLPINRKEVYYTATVLPRIVCADGFAHINRLGNAWHRGAAGQRRLGEYNEAINLH